MYSKTLQLIAQRLLQTQQKLAVAESCTGGWVCKCCTDLPGSSAWFDCGFVTYSNFAKHHQLDVSLKVLQEYGAVSEPVVKEMLSGVLQHSRAHYALAISGVAGPTGGSDDKPVGTVVIGWAANQPQVISQVERFQFEGDRERVRKQAVQAALSGLLERIT